MYCYFDSMLEDVKEAIREGEYLNKYHTRDELEEALNDELWIDDGVTGNASGSYFCNAWKAREAVIDDGMEHFTEACRDFGIEAAEVGERFIDEDWERMDVTIRCYLLGQVIGQALDDMEDDGVFDEDAGADEDEETDEE